MKVSFDRLGAWLGSRVVRHKWLTLVVSTVVFAVVALGARRLAFSTDYRIFFSKEDPGLASFQHLESAFTKTDNVLFVVKARRGTVFDREVLAAVQELTEAGWKLPFASRTDSVTNFPRATATDDDIVQAPLVGAPSRSLGDEELRAVRDAVVSEPLLFGSLVSRDETTTGVNVTIRLPGKRNEEVAESVGAARKVAADVQARHPEIELRVCGMAAMNDAFMHTSVRDLAVMLPLMLVVMLVVMALSLRSTLATVAVAAVIALSSGMSMGIAGWLGYPLTPPSIAAPIMVLTVAVADGIHIVLSAMEGIAAGKTRDEAAAHAIETNLEAVTYTCLTTLVGFLCLNYSEALPVRHLANMTAFGVAVALVFSITLLPALLAILPVPGRAAKAHDDRGLTQRIVRFVVARPRAVLLAFAVLGGAATWQASRLETDDRFVKYFSASTQFRQDVDFTMKNLSGIYRLEYQVGAGAPSGIGDPAYLERLDAFVAWLRAQPEVHHVYAITDVLKRVSQVAHGGDAAAYRLPATRAEAGQHLLLYEMGLPPGLELTDRVDVDKSSSRVTVTVRDMSSREMRAFADRTEEWLRANAPRSMWTQATGPVVIFSQLSDRNAKSMVQADFVSLALISLCMVLVLRSVKLGLLSVIPNVLPIVVGYGVWRVAVGQINVVATVAASVALGIIVDDTIHFLTKYQRLQRTGLPTPEAVSRTLGHVGPAMLAATAVLVCGFGVLTFSAFQMTSWLGWLTCVVVGIAPLADLLLMPALLVFADPVRAKPEPDTNHARLLTTEGAS